MLSIIEILKKTHEAYQKNLECIKKNQKHTRVAHWTRPAVKTDFISVGVAFVVAKSIVAGSTELNAGYIVMVWITYNSYFVT